MTGTIFFPRFPAGFPARERGAFPASPSGADKQNFFIS